MIVQTLPVTLFHFSPLPHFSTAENDHHIPALAKIQITEIKPEYNILPTCTPCNKTASPATSITNINPLITDDILFGRIPAVLLRTCLNHFLARRIFRFQFVFCAYHCLCI